MSDLSVTPTGTPDAYINLMDYISATTTGTISQNIMKSVVIKCGPFAKKCDAHNTHGFLVVTSDCCQSTGQPTG